jgi:exodeoxyribonuclease VII large subunit
MMEELILSPSDFVGLVNQTLEIAYPLVVIEGELSSFRISKNRWVYFDLKDEFSSVKFFGSIYQLPGPLEDGMNVRVIGNPKLHPRFGFSISFHTIQPAGEGSLKKAADLLASKLEAEGLFANERKRALPAAPVSIGLITAAGSAAYGDFIKIIGSRWGGLDISVIDVLVQGESSPTQLVKAIEIFNQMSKPPEVLVMTRGGGSLEDLAAFSDERVVRAVASSRIPMLVAIGHEADVSLAELAADMRASTPTNAAQIVVPDRQQEITALEYQKSSLAALIGQLQRDESLRLANCKEDISRSVDEVLKLKKHNLESLKNLSRLLNPKEALKRGYAIVSAGNAHLKSVSQAVAGMHLGIELSDGRIKAEVISTEGK